MRVFVTGGTGFIGSHFIEQAQKAGHEVVALHRKASKPAVKLSKQPQWIEGDLETVPDDAFNGCQGFIHLAAHGVADAVGVGWDACFRWNVTAPLNLWLKASKAGVRRFVICGSCFEYGTSGQNFDYIPTNAPLLPTGPYHSSKAAASMAALGFAVSHQREIVILRPFHVYGEGEPEGRFWPSLRKAALEGKNFKMTDGKQVRDFISVHEVANKFILSLESKKPKPGNPIIENIGTGKPKTLLEFAQNEWCRFDAEGVLLPGTVSMRPNEILRYVPLLSD